MLTSAKSKSLMVFAHSRLLELIEDKEGLSQIKVKDTNINEILTYLDESHCTVNHLYELKNQQLQSQISYYYTIAMSEMDKNITKGDYIIESIIGINIMKHLITKGFVTNDLMVITQSLLDGLAVNDSKEIRKTTIHMRIVAQRIVKKVSSSNYTQWKKRKKRNRIKNEKM